MRRALSTRSCTGLLTFGAVSPRNTDQLHDDATGGRQPTASATRVTGTAIMDKHADLLQPAPQTESTRPTSTNDSVILNRVPCNVCQHEIPASEAVVAEATDYVVYFCGLDCYERWRTHPERR